MELVDSSCATTLAFDETRRARIPPFLVVEYDLHVRFGFEVEDE